jgi:phage terminase small subunit
MLRTEHGLTIKQETFARAVAETGSLTAAYRQAFDAKNMKPETVHNRAYVLSNRSEVRARVKELMAEKQTKEQWDRDRAHSFVRERLVLESTEAKDARDRLKAVELLGQLAEFDLFASKKSHVTVRRDQKDPEQNLRAVIQRILAKADSIADQQATGASGRKLH